MHQRTVYYTANTNKYIIQTQAAVSYTIWNAIYRYKNTYKNFKKIF